MDLVERLERAKRQARAQGIPVIVGTGSGEFRYTARPDGSVKIDASKGAADDCLLTVLLGGMATIFNSEG